MSIAETSQSNGRAPKRQKTNHTPKTPYAESESSSDDLSDEEDNDQASVSSPSEDATDTNQLSHPSQAKKLFKGNTQSTTSRNSATMSSASLAVKTQILLDELRPNHDLRIKKTKPIIDRIIATIKSISETNPMSITHASSFAQKNLRIAIPWTHRPAEDIQYSFQYLTPTKITTEGSLVHSLGTQETAALTVVPEMPKALFQEKDYLNYRCINKRAFYLACIAAAVKNDLDKDVHVQFALSDDNRLLPIIKIMLVANTKISGATSICINPSFPMDLGPLPKMSPFQNCIRKSESPATDAATVTDNSAFYNSTVRCLCSTKHFHDLIKNAISKADNFRDACLLGSLWLQRLGFSSDSNRGGFGLQEWSSICALLLESGGYQGRPLFSPRYSTVQFFKAMLQTLSMRNMNDPFIVRGAPNFNSHAKVPVFYDALTGVNLLYKMTPWSYLKLRTFALTCLGTLSSRQSEGFDAAFVTVASELSFQYDETYELADIAPSRTINDDRHEKEKIYETLKRGLGDRAQLIDIMTEPTSSWNTTEPAPPLKASQLIIGILIDSSTVTRLVDHGPSVEEKADSESFRSFWREKAELRKFKDGRICESLVWSADIPVTQQIVQYLCAQHLKVYKSSIHASPSLPFMQLRSRVPAEESFASVNTKFQSLSSTLHHLDGLPLPIRSVTAASQLARSSSKILPLEPGFVQPIDVVVQFDSSGRWPDNLQAVQYTKIAFLAKISDLITKKNHKLEVRLGVENTSGTTHGLYNTSFLDVIDPPAAANLSPIIFRIRIYHDRELHLLQQTLSDKTILPAVRETYQSALQYMKQRFVAAPSHTTAIRSLMTQFQPLSATVRLLKTWISAHHLSQHIPSEALEIIAARVFLSPAPWSVPGTATTAFSRCLYFLSHWDWSVQPLVVDLSPSQDLTLEQRNEFETRFSAWRQMDPNMNTVTWFVGTNLDSTGVVWTQGVGDSGANPPRVVASRLTALAGAATKLLAVKSSSANKIMSQSDWSSIFTSSLDDFDFVIHLKPSRLSSKKKSKDAEFKNLQLASSLDADTTGIEDATSFVEDLTRSFKNAAIFFYGERHSDSNVIGGLWRPGVRGSNAKPWKIRLGYSTVPVKMTSVDEEQAEGMCNVNFEGMLAEMEAMGEGLVDRIAVKEN